MGRAFMTDMGRMCQERQMVLIFDTFEQISSETRNWLDEWLFEHLFDQFPNLVVVIAGRPDIHEYVKQPRPWKSIMHVHETFSTPEETDIRDYLAKNNLKVTDAEVLTFLTAACYTMSVMSKLRDAYLAGFDYKVKKRMSKPVRKNLEDLFAKRLSDEEMEEHIQVHLEFS